MNGFQIDFGFRGKHFKPYTHTQVESIRYAWIEIASVFICLYKCSLTTLTTTYFMYLSGKNRLQKKFIRPIFLPFNSWANVCLYFLCVFAREWEAIETRSDIGNKFNVHAVTVVEKKRQPWLTNSFTLLTNSLCLFLPFLSFFPFHPIESCGLFLLYPCVVVKPWKKKPPLHFTQTTTTRKKEKNRQKHTYSVIFFVQLVKQAKLLQLGNRFFPARLHTSAFLFEAKI